MARRAPSAPPRSPTCLTRRRGGASSYRHSTWWCPSPCGHVHVTPHALSDYDALLGDGRRVMSAQLSDPAGRPRLALAPRAPRRHRRAATKNRWGAVELLGYVAESRRPRSARAAASSAGYARSQAGPLQADGGFRLGLADTHRQAAVEAALELDFLEQHRNVVLVAPQGLGKTMIAQNIAHQAVLAGHTALFTTASQLLLDLGAQDSAAGPRPPAQALQRPTACSSSTRSATSPTTRATPTCSSRSSPAATSRRASSSPPTCPLASGPPSSRTPPAPRRSSIASSTTPTSSPSRARATGAAPLRRVLLRNESGRSLSRDRAGKTHQAAEGRSRKQRFLTINNMPRRRG